MTAPYPMFLLASVRRLTLCIKCKLDNLHSMNGLKENSSVRIIEHVRTDLSYE